MNPNGTKSPMFTASKKDLQYALEHGIINIDDVQKKINMTKKEEALKKHKYDIWQGNNSRWYTYLPDMKKANGRKLVAKSTREKLEDVITQYFSEQESNSKKHTFEDLYHSWIKHKASKVSKGTLERIQVDYNKFYRSAPFLKTNVKDIECMELEEWLQQQIVQYQMNSKTFYNMQTILKNCLKYAQKIKVLQEDV